jgi:hypothetical protein
MSSHNSTHNHHYRNTDIAALNTLESAIWARPHRRFEADGTSPMSPEPTAKSATPRTPKRSALRTPS